MVTKSTGIISTVAGSGSYLGFSGDGGLATSALLSSPRSIAVDASGNIYITENRHMRMVTKSTGVISTVADTESASYGGENGQVISAMMNYPFGVAVDASGNVYVADTLNNRIRSACHTHLRSYSL